MRPPYCGRQNANTTLSLRLLMKFSKYRTGGNLTIFDKDHDTAEGRSRSLPEVKFLQPSMGVRYDCLRARVPKRKNIFLERGWKLVMHITVPRAVIIHKVTPKYKLRVPLLLFLYIAAYIGLIRTSLYLIVRTPRSLGYVVT